MSADRLAEIALQLKTAREQTGQGAMAANIAASGALVMFVLKTLPPESSAETGFNNLINVTDYERALEGVQQYVSTGNSPLLLSASIQTPAALHRVLLQTRPISPRLATDMEKLSASAIENGALPRGELSHLFNTLSNSLTRALDQLTQDDPLQNRGFNQLAGEGKIHDLFRALQELETRGFSTTLLKADPVKQLPSGLVQREKLPLFKS